MNNFVTFVGYDRREDVAYQVCRHSLLKNNDTHVVPLIQDQLRAEGIYTREQDLRASTDFSLTRYLVPYLMNYEGYSVFCDCDLIFTNTLHPLMQRLRFIAYPWSVSVVKHQYQPSTMEKFNHNTQHLYPMKNWSSFMVFRNEYCKKLTPEYVNKASPSDLHQFKWCEEKDIIPVDHTYNFLVGEYDAGEDVPIGIHYTLGGPWEEESSCHDYFGVWEECHDEWLETRKIQ